MVRSDERRTGDNRGSLPGGPGGVQRDLRPDCDGFRGGVSGTGNGRGGRAGADRPVGSRAKAATVVTIPNKRQVGNALTYAAHLITIALLVAVILLLVSHA